MKRSRVRRIWKDAEIKRGTCRVCREGSGVELAHITERANDVFWPLDEPRPELAGLSRDKFDRWQPYRVSPLRVVALCPEHHRAYDSHDLDLSPYLTPEESAQAVLDAGSLELARIRLTGSRRSA